MQNSVYGWAAFLYSVQKIFGPVPLSLKGSVSDPKNYKWFWVAHFATKSSSFSKPGRQYKANMAFQPCDVGACLREERLYS